MAKNGLFILDFSFWTGTHLGQDASANERTTVGIPLGIFIERCILERKAGRLWVGQIWMAYDLDQQLAKVKDPQAAIVNEEHIEMDGEQNGTKIDPA